MEIDEPEEEEVDEPLPLGQTYNTVSTLQIV